MASAYAAGLRMIVSTPRSVGSMRAATEVVPYPSPATVPSRAAPRTPWTRAAGTAAATFPDLDFVLGYFSELAYLRGHRGLTHSLPLLPLWGLLLAWPMARPWRRGGRPATDWRAFYGVVCAALLIHILGDLITQFGTMILAPNFSAWSRARWVSSRPEIVSGKPR